VQTLLFIEDDQDIRAALRLALEDEGYKVRRMLDHTSSIAGFLSTPTGGGQRGA